MPSRLCMSNGASALSKSASHSFRTSSLFLPILIPFFVLTHISYTCRILLGYFIAYATYIPAIMKFRREQRRDPMGTQPEGRLWWLLWSKHPSLFPIPLCLRRACTSDARSFLPVLHSRPLLISILGTHVAAPLEPIGLFGFAWTSLGPGHTHWIAPMIFSVLIAIANVRILLLVLFLLRPSHPFGQLLSTTLASHRNVRLLHEHNADWRVFLSYSTRSTCRLSTTWWRHTVFTPPLRQEVMPWPEISSPAFQRCTLHLVRPSRYYRAIWMYTHDHFRFLLHIFQPTYLIIVVI